MDDIDFIHITKTAGTSIEKWGLQNNIKWSYEKKEIFDKGEYYIIWGSEDNYLEPWHIPPKCFVKNENYPYKNTTFTVVRNPYTRIISEYYCPWIGSEYMHEHNLNDFNLWIGDFLKQQGKRGHGIPQSLYKPVNYILHFENLGKEFNDFVKSIDPSLSTVLPHVNKSKIIKNKFTIKDISRENIKLINEIYSDDFDNFGYEKI